MWPAFLFVWKTPKEKVFQKRCVRNSFRSFFFEVGKLGPEEEVVPTTVVKTKHGLSIKVAEKQKLRIVSFFSFFQWNRNFSFFSLSFHLFFSYSEASPIGIECQPCFSFLFTVWSKKNSNSCFFFFSCLPYVEVRNFIFLFDFFFFSTQHKLLTEFPHQELFFCSIRFPGPGHKADLFLFLGVPIGAPWSYR